MTWHLLERSGVEIEYMIVSRDTFDIDPIADVVLTDLDCDSDGDLVRGEFTWSNELTNHVLELKTSAPFSEFDELHQGLAKEVRWMNEALLDYNVCLLPGGMHPWMNPVIETELWPLGSHEIYRVYDDIFNCASHGWANVQSMHLNLSFNGDEEFARLHAAIRILLPIMPALSASSPFVGGEATGELSSRLGYYRSNQKKISIISGEVIPEAIFSESDYDAQIFDPLTEVMKAHDPNGVLDPIFLNSRGAIARFDRGSIEIRILDSQECPRADLAIAEFVVAALRWLAAQDLGVLKSAETDDLANILWDVAKLGLNGRVYGAPLMTVLGLPTGEALSAEEVLSLLFEKMEGVLSHDASEVIAFILAQGNLAQRILRATTICSRQSLRKTYSALAFSLESNQLFKPVSIPS